MPNNLTLLRIRALRPGFRRAGVLWSTQAQKMPAALFSAADLAALLADPMLVVEELPTLTAFTAATAVHLTTSDAADLAGVGAASLGSVAVVPADYATQSTRATLAAKKITGTSAGVATHVIGVDATDRRWAIALATPVTVTVGGIVSLSPIDYEAL